MILRISIFLILLLLLLLKFSYLKSCKKRNVFFLFPSIVLLFVTLFLAFRNDFVFSHPNMVGIYLVVFLCWTLPLLVWTILQIPEKYIRRQKIRKAFVCLKYIVSGTVLCVILHGYLWGYKIIDKHYITYSSDKLPSAFNNYCIVQISDLHLGSFKNHTQVLDSMVSNINVLNPDLIVFTGDLMTNISAEANIPIINKLKRLQAKDGIFSVPGNHDYGYYMNWETEKDRIHDTDMLYRKERESISWTLLIDTTIVLHRKNDSISIWGTGYNRREFFALKHIQNLQSPTPFNIMLLHDPKYWKAILREKDIQLTLSGHTHGFQIAAGSLTPASLFFKASMGLYNDEKGRALYVNRGFGEALLPIRIGAWPEITVITLKTPK